MALSALQKRMLDIGNRVKQHPVSFDSAGNATLFGVASVLKPKTQKTTSKKPPPTNVSFVVLSNLLNCDFPNGKISPDGNSVVFTNSRTGKVQRIQAGESTIVSIFGFTNPPTTRCELVFNNCSAEWNSFQASTGENVTRLAVRASKAVYPDFEQKAQATTFACSKFTGSNMQFFFIPSRLFPPKDYIDNQLKKIMGDGEASSSSGGEKTEEELKKEKKERRKAEKKEFVNILPEYLKTIDTLALRDSILVETGVDFDHISEYLKGNFKYWVISFPGTMSGDLITDKSYPNLDQWHALHTGIKAIENDAWDERCYIEQDGKPKIYEKTAEWPFENATVFRRCVSVVFGYGTDETNTRVQTASILISVFGRALGSAFGILNPKYQKELLAPILKELPMCMALNLNTYETSKSTFNNSAENNTEDIEEGVRPSIVYQTVANHVIGNMFELLMKQCVLISCSSAIHWYNKYIVNFANDFGVQVNPKDLYPTRTNPTLLNPKLKFPNPISFLQSEGNQFSEAYGQRIICLNESNIGVEKGGSVEDEYFFLALFPNLDKSAFATYFTYVTEHLLPKRDGSPISKPSFETMKGYESLAAENDSLTEAMFADPNAIPYVFLLKKEVFQNVGFYKTAFASFDYSEHMERLDQLATAALQPKASSSSSSSNSSSSSSVVEDDSIISAHEVPSAQEVDYDIMEDQTYLSSPQDDSFSSSSGPASSSSQPKKKRSTPVSSSSSSSSSKSKKEDNSNLKKQRK